MDLILPNTDNMIFNTSCMHFIPLVFDISFCVSGLAHLHMTLRPPLVSIQEPPITLYKLVGRRFGERNENSREENNILSMCAFAVFSILIIFTKPKLFGVNYENQQFQVPCGLHPLAFDDFGR